jgi:hypothetical protein
VSAENDGQFMSPTEEPESKRRGRLETAAMIDPREPREYLYEAEAGNKPLIIFYTFRSTKLMLQVQIQQLYKTITIPKPTRSPGTPKQAHQTWRQRGTPSSH